MGNEAAYDEFVRARLPHLLRLGRALTLDDDAGAQLVAVSLAPVLARWDPASAFTAEDDVRRRMVRQFLRKHAPVGRGDGRFRRDAETWADLAELSPQARALLALQLLEDLTEGQAADLVRCSDAAALDALRGVDAPRVRAALEESVVVDEGELQAAVRRDADRQRRRSTALVGAVAVAVTLLAAAAVTVIVVRGDDGGNRGLPEKAYALAASAADQVWAITDDPDCETCSQLWTGDGTDVGWRLLHTFDRPGPEANLLMAPDGENGWAWFGRDFLQATHDGGDSWVIPGIDLGNSGVDVAVAGSAAWVLLQAGDQVRLWTSEVGTDSWEEVAAPTPPVHRVSLAPWGDDMWLTHFQQGAVGLTSATAPDAEPAPLPCGVEAFPPRQPPSPDRGALWLTCADGGPGILVKRSLDGVTWNDVGRSLASDADSAPISDEATLLRTVVGVRVIGTDGQVDVPLDLKGEEVVEHGMFVDSEVGFLLTTAGRVLRSADAGRSWSEIG